MPTPSETHQPSEALLVAAAKLGDRAAFSQLVRAHQSRLRGLIRYLCSDPTLADDIAQQAFLTAWDTIVQLRDVHAFESWLKRIAVNLWLKHQRKKDPLRHSEDEASTKRNYHETPDVGIDINQALATLSEQVRLCVLLSLVEGMSHGEIAETTNTPLGTVKSHIRRGTQQLQTLLEPYRTKGPST